ncbi:MAG TPA: WD40 repeat domain-containing protein [Gemmata sp.]
MMFTLKSDLTPEGGLQNPARLAFSPDGTALLASGGDDVQVWPRWLDGPPRPVVTAPGTLERATLNPDGSLVYLYRSGNSYTDVLTVATGKITASGLPPSDPSWAHFDATGGFFLVCREQGTLARYDYTPGTKKKVREAWALMRHSGGTQRSRKPLGSHYRFGAICGPAGVFVALEYKFGGNEPFHGLTARSVKDGAVVFHRKLRSDTATRLLEKAGLALTIHPSGGYMAYPDGPEIRLRSLSDRVKVRAKVPAPQNAGAEKATAKKPKKPKPEVHAVAFNPAGTLLAAVGDSGVVTLYDTKAWAVAGAFDWKIGTLRAVCFSADGTRAAVLSETGNIMVWDLDL